MNEVYRAIGTTKQNIHQRLDRYLHQQEEKSNLLSIILKARKDHPQMGAGALYKLLKPEFTGRDRFRQWYNEMGLRLQQKKNFRRTTDSSGVIRFPNLLQWVELRRVNQVLVSDITYYEINGEWYYLTFIMDLYSRRIKGYCASQTLKTTDTTIPALQMALKGMEPSATEGIIFHSDGGGQYYCKEFIEITRNSGISNSMCETVYENPHAERINGTIKNSYLKHYNPQNFSQLTRMLTKAVYMYNHQKPHEALGGFSPMKFEELIGANSQKLELLTKKKVAKKKYYDNIDNQLLKTVNLIQ